MKSSPEPNSDVRAGGTPDAREYVSVVADYLPDGMVMPVSVAFDGGPPFKVEKVIGAVRMSATKYGGDATRFHVRIEDREHYLFFEDAARGAPAAWFVADR